MDQRLEALGHDDADRFAGANAVGPVPLGVAVAQGGQVDQAVAAQDDLAAVVGLMAEGIGDVAVRVVPRGVVQEVAGAEPGSVMRFSRTDNGATGLMALIRTPLSGFAGWSPQVRAALGTDGRVGRGRAGRTARTGPVRRVELVGRVARSS